MNARFNPEALYLRLPVPLQNLVVSLEGASVDCVDATVKRTAAWRAKSSSARCSKAKRLSTIRGSALSTSCKMPLRPLSGVRGLPSTACGSTGTNPFL